MQLSKSKFALLSILLLTFAATSALLITSPLFAADNSAEDEHSTVVPSDGIKSLEVSTTSGNIHLIGNSTQDISIRANFTVKGRKQSVCDDLIKKVKIDINRRSDNLKIEAKRPRKRGYSFNISFEIYYPADLKAKAESVNGSVDADSISGDVELSTVNGDILGRKLSGKISAETVNGGITLQSITGNVESATVNGSIDVSCIAPAPRRIKMGAINGALKLLLPEDVDADLNIDAIHGRILVEGLGGTSGIKTNKHFETTIGSGTGKYELETVNGSITVIVDKHLHEN